MGLLGLIREPCHLMNSRSNIRSGIASKIEKAANNRVVVPKLGKGGSILVLLKGLQIGWNLTEIAAIHSSVLNDMVNQAKLFQFNARALPGELDAKEDRDIPTFNFQVHLPLILLLVNQSIRRITIHTKLRQSST